MRTCLRRVGAGALLAAALPVGAAAQATGWRTVTDRPAQVTTEATIPADGWRFTQMAPGWHITTRPGAVMFDPAARAAGRYVVESVQILFPGSSQSGSGVMLGGTDLEGSNPAYIAFLVRGDGSAAIERRSGGSTALLAPWMPVPAARPQVGNATASNTLRVAVDTDSVRFTVNGQPAATLARAGLALDGLVGFRTGDNMNLHVTTLDIMHRLAPVPAPRP